jgi:hypothetical protein
MFDALTGVSMESKFAAPVYLQWDPGYSGVVLPEQKINALPVESDHFSGKEFADRSMLQVLNLQLGGIIYAKILLPDLLSNEDLLAKKKRFVVQRPTLLKIIPMDQHAGTVG